MAPRLTLVSRQTEPKPAETAAERIERRLNSVAAAAGAPPLWVAADNDPQPCDWLVAAPALTPEQHAVRACRERLALRGAPPLVDWNAPASDRLAWVRRTFGLWA